MLSKILIAALCAAPLASALPHAPARPVPAAPAEVDLQARLRALEQELVPPLTALAEEAQKAKAFAFRNAVYELVLEFDPDHADARRFLGYKLDRKSGEWVLPKEPRPAKDAQEDALPPLRERRAGILGDHRDRVLALLDAEPELPVRLRNEVLAGLLARMPEDPRLNGLLGYVLDTDGDGRFVLAETLRARTVRAAGRTRLAELRDALGQPEVRALGGWEKDLGKNWKSEALLDGVRVTGTVGDRELGETARAVHLSRSWVGHVFEEENPWDLERWSLDGDGTLRPLLEGMGVTEPDRLERILRSGGSMLGARRGVIARDNSDARKDACVRYTVNGFINGRYGTDVRMGWAHEGFGMYLTQQVVGTRLTYFIRTTEYTEGRRNSASREMLDQDANWLKMARRVLEDERKPYNMAFALGRDVNNMTGDDLLVGFALAAYLLEGQGAEVATRVLTGIGRDERASVEVLEEVLGYDPWTLTRRLARWLDETGR